MSTRFVVESQRGRNSCRLSTFSKDHEMRSSIKRFQRDERGATATEYALLIVFIALAIAVGAQTLGTNISNLFSAIGTQLSTITLPKF